MWLDSRRVELNSLFVEFVSKSWETIIMREQKYSKEILGDYVSKRVNKLKKVQKKEKYESELLCRYEKRRCEWLQNIYGVEMDRFTRALQDFDGHQSFVRSEWSLMSYDLTRERALWGLEENPNARWRLDYTEGLNRMRKRLQVLPYNEENPSAIVKDNGSKRLSTLRNANEKSAKRKSMIEVDKELTEDHDSSDNIEEEKSLSDASNFYENSVSKDDQEEDQQFLFEEDKNRKVLCLLDEGDIVVDVFNVSRIEGLDACEGLLLLCKNNIYLIDNFFQTSDGEVVEIWDVPQEDRDQYLVLLAQAAGVITEHIHKLDELHRCRKWSYLDLLDVFKRRFLFRDVALEVFFNDGQNALFTVNIQEREELYSKLVSRVKAHEESGESVFSREDDTIASGSSSSTFTLSGIFGKSALQGLTKRWQNREISNFQYLMYLNSLSGRSYNDLTQYPVFPWILADYTSKELDLTNPATFRDLKCPMGAQTEERKLGYLERFKEWGEADTSTPAFHYGTHYSSAMIVCSFLIRLEPFTQQFLKLQGGSFDHADRLFDSIGAAWESASEKNMGDVRELIPEFFYLPEFLTNASKFDFGSKQGTGEVIDSVVLPPWAHGDPKIFIQKHNQVSLA